MSGQEVALGRGRKRRIPYPADSTSRAALAIEGLLTLTVPLVGDVLEPIGIAGARGVAVSSKSDVSEPGGPVPHVLRKLPNNLSQLGRHGGVLDSGGLGNDVSKPIGPPHDGGDRAPVGPAVRADAADRAVRRHPHRTTGGQSEVTVKRRRRERPHPSQPHAGGSGGGGTTLEGGEDPKAVSDYQRARGNPADGSVISPRLSTSGVDYPGGGAPTPASEQIISGRAHNDAETNARGDATNPIEERAIDEPPGVIRDIASGRDHPPEGVLRGPLGGPQRRPRTGHA